MMKELGREWAKFSHNERQKFDELAREGKIYFNFIKIEGDTKESLESSTRTGEVCSCSTSCRLGGPKKPFLRI